jgi:hypothetical protein
MIEHLPLNFSYCITKATSIALGIMVLMLHEGVTRIIDLATAESKSVSAFKLNRLVEGKGCHGFSHREFSPIMFAEVVESIALTT